MTLAGSVCIRNGFELDYPFRESIQSLLPVCDEVVVCDGESTDGTQTFLRGWVEQEPKLNLCVYPWPHPKGDADFWVKWLNYAREHIRSDWHFQLDADEILHEKSYSELRQFIEGPNRTGIVTRWNFWRDHRHTIPVGVCLGKHVIRIAPARMWLASDGEHPMGAEASALANGTGVEIYHYGFLRKREAFFQKAKALQGYFFNAYDPRLEAAEKYEGNWATMPGITSWENSLNDYNETHPAVIKDWLIERGYEA